MESTDTSDFIYTISVQGHGAYPTEEVLKDPHIKVTLKEDDEARQNQLTYYANQIYEMDLFVAELTRQLNDFNEPCILVMYGDHLPSLGIEEDVYKRQVDILKLKKEHFKLDPIGAKIQLNIGIPMALQFSITAIGTMILQAALNLLGSTVVASYTAACKVEQLVTQAFQAMGMTMATYSAQNWGIHSTERIRKGQKTAMVLSCSYAVIIYFVVLAILPFMTSLFFDGDLTTVIGYVREYIQICGLCFIPLGMIFIYINVLQGCGYALFPTLGGVVELISRSVFAFMAARAKSYTGICVANASAWVTAGIFLWIAYLFIMKDILKKDKERELQKKADI